MNYLNIINLNPQKCEISQREFDIFLSEPENTKYPSLFINPSIIVEYHDNRFFVIYGFKTIEYYQKKNITTIPVFQINSEINKLKKFIILAEFHKQFRDFYPIELAYFVDLLLSKKLTKIEIWDNFSTLLELPKNVMPLKNLIKIKYIPKPLTDYLINKNSPIKFYSDLVDLDVKVNEFLISLIELAKPSLSILKEIVTNLTEIGKLEDSNCYQIIIKLKLNILLNSDENSSNKLSKIRNRLNECRYPVITKHKLELHKIIKSIKIPQGLKLVTDNNFENRQIRVEFLVKSDKDIQKYRDFFSGKEFEKLSGLLGKM